MVFPLDRRIHVFRAYQRCKRALCKFGHRLKDGVGLHDLFGAFAHAKANIDDQIHFGVPHARVHLHPLVTQANDTRTGLVTVHQLQDNLEQVTNTRFRKDAGNHFRTGVLAACNHRHLGCRHLAGLFDGVCIKALTSTANARSFLLLLLKELHHHK